MLIANSNLAAGASSSVGYDIQLGPVKVDLKAITNADLTPSGYTAGVSYGDPAAVFDEISVDQNLTPTGFKAGAKFSLLVKSVPFLKDIADVKFKAGVGYDNCGYFISGQLNAKEPTVQFGRFANAYGQTEPPRVCRRPFRLSHAASFCSSSMT
jgi:hypothetical protein